jgi:predicted dehydrogenase
LGASVLRAFIIGCGNVAGGYDLRGGNREVWTHAKAYQLTPGVELVGVIDSSPTIARQFAKTWRVAFSGTKLLPALERTRPDIVSICSPTHTHVPLIKDLCRAGVRGILCEKPIAYDLRTAEQAVELCEKNGVLLVVNYQRNWDRQLNQLGAKIHLGEFGSAELIRVLYSKGLLHNGSHFVSLLSRWFGELDLERILSVQSCDRDDVQADFAATSPAAERILFQSAPAQNYALNELEILFEHGRLELRGGGLDLLWTGRHQDPLLPKDRALVERPRRLPVTLPRAMLEVVRNFIDTIRGKATLQSDPRQALQTLRFCVRVRTLARERHA